MTQPRDLSALRAIDPHTGKPRHKTREVRVGDKVVGGDNPIWVQSMTTTDTLRRRGDASRRSIALEEAGCETRPRHRAQAGGRRASSARSRSASSIPLICDIHFDYKMALAALDHPVDKIRINPGNIGGIRPLPPGASARPRTRACRCASASTPAAWNASSSRSTASPARRRWSRAPCATSRSPRAKAITTSSCR